MNDFRNLEANQFKIRPAYWVLFFSLAGFGLRLHQLNLQPLWGDEGWSFYFAAQPLSQLLLLTAIDIHPPLYYILLKSWLFIVGFGPEEARFFSVIVGTILIPVLAVLGQHLLDRRVGLAAAGVVTVMPMAVYYSQEVRMYGLVTLLGALSTYFFIKNEQAGEKLPGNQRPQSHRLSMGRETSHSAAGTELVGGVGGHTSWSLAHILATTAALYTMYYAAFILLAQFLYTVISVLKTVKGSKPIEIPARSSTPAEHFLGIPRVILTELRPFIIIGLLYVPWVIYAGLSTTNYIINKRVVENYPPLGFADFFSNYFVAFSLGHLARSLQPYVWIALLFVGIALIGFIAVLYTKRGAYPYLYLYLFMPLLSGYIINLLFPFTPPYFERTWLIAAPAYWLFIAVGLVWLWDWQQLFAGVMGVVMLLVTTVNLISFYTLPRYPHQDYRPLLRDISARATPEDTVLASYQWQLGFYYAYLAIPHPYFFAVPGWGQGWAGDEGRSQRAKDLAAIFNRSPRLWFPAHQTLGHFWEDDTEADIAKLGYPARLEWYNPQTKLTVAGSAQAPLVEAPTANFENYLSLIEASIGGAKYEAGRGIVPIQLIWRKEKSLGSEHRVSLRLADPMGRTWAIRDSNPLAGQTSFTNLSPDDTLVDRHGLLISAGTPPSFYRLLLSVRRVSDDRPLDLLDSAGQPLGAELLIGEIEVIDPNPPVGPAALPVQIATEAIFGQEARLVGYSLGQGPFKAGEILPLNLFWASLTDNPGLLTTIIELHDNSGQPVFSLEREPLRPSRQWQRGTLLRDPYDLSLPPTLPPGDYRLIIALLNQEQIQLAAGGSTQLPLTEVTVIDRPHVFDAPDPQISLDVNFNDQAKLVGVNLPQSKVKAGANLPLTLHWQALAPFDRSWKVFVHLTNGEGQIITQQDQIPGAGQFPTTSWLPNEYLLDSYNLFIPADTPPGQQAYRLEIGLYNSNDGARLPVTKAGNLVSDRLILENWPISIE